VVELDCHRGDRGVGVLERRGVAEFSRDRKSVV